MANKIISLYETVAEAQSQYLTNELQAEAMKIFAIEIENLLMPLPGKRNITTQSEHFFRGKPWLGSMAMFIYEPTGPNKRNLQYYDKFPLVIPVEIYKDPEPAFAGINLHYLDYRTRALLLDRLMMYGTKGSNRLNRINYDILASLKKLKLFKPTWHRYNLNRVKTRIAMVPKPLWPTAIFMPTHDFRKVKNTGRIWRDSKKIIKSTNK